MVHWFQWYDWSQTEKDVNPMVLLVNMHLIKGTYITGQFPIVHWYQWYDWYQQKMPFQWFYCCKTSSLLHQAETRYNSYELELPCTQLDHIRK